jgi:hypothetical protein
VIRAYDAAGNVIETHEHKDDFRGPGHAAANSINQFADVDKLAW